MPVERTVLPVRYHGRRVVEVRLHGEPRDRESVRRFVARLMGQDRAELTEVSVALPYAGGWRSGPWGREPRLFSLADYYDVAEVDDPETYDDVRIYVRHVAPQAGGCDGGTNDCLYECLRRIYGTARFLPAPIKTPEVLKSALGIERAAPVPLSRLQRLEEVAEALAINVTGDHARASKSKADRVANLVLSGGHYSLATTTRRKPPTLSPKPRSPMLIRTDGVEGVTWGYDGVEVRPWSSEEVQAVRRNPMTSPFVIVPARTDDLVAERARWLEGAEGLAEATGGLVDLRRCGSSKQMALALFAILSRGISSPDPLLGLEAVWIERAMMGGIIWGLKQWEGEAIGCDVVSMYPSLMIAKGATWPTSAGEFRTVKDGAEPFYRYGIYWATVEASDRVGSLFRYSKTGYYTYVDLEVAKRLGLAISLAQDGAPNALIYERAKRVGGEVLFAPFVVILYGRRGTGGIVKPDHVKTAGGETGRAAKSVLNTLLGALCETRRVKGYASAEAPFDVPQGHGLAGVTPHGRGGLYRVECEDLADPFAGEFPRVAPFLIAAGRRHVSGLLAPVRERVRRVHTDGFVVEGGADGLPIGDPMTLGALKLEHTGHCLVANAMRSHGPSPRAGMSFWRPEPTPNTTRSNEQHRDIP